MHSAEILSNLWWAVWPSSLLAAAPVSLVRLGERVVLWRDAAGAARAALAACPHRSADLGHGRVVDGELVCAYHGFCFNTDGACTQMPCDGPQARIPPTLQLAMRPVVEAHGFLWLSQGACTTPVPWVPEAPVRGPVGHMTWQAPLSRVIEAMLDIHHFPFAHRRYTPAITRLEPFEARFDDDDVLRSSGTLRRDGDSRGQRFEMNLSFPGALHVRASPRINVAVVCTPVSETETWIAFRFAVDVPVVGDLLASLLLWLELRLIQPDDQRLLESMHLHSPRQLVRADKAMTLWQARRRRQQNLPVVAPPATRQ